jgi:glutamate/tyrosine decarboxylase-like PLP-dependent enzyme
MDAKRLKSIAAKSLLVFVLEGWESIYASTEVHMSIPKAVALLGLGRENLRLIPVDESFRMVPEQLEYRMRQDKESRSRLSLPLCAIGKPTP